MQKLVSLIKSHLFIVVLEDRPKKTLVWFMSENVCLCSFLVLWCHVLCLSLCHFKFIFVHDVRMCSNFIDFTCSFPTFPVPLAKETVFFPILYSCLLCWKLYTCWFIFGLSILFHMSVFVPIPHPFDYCNCVVLSEVEESYASCFVFSSCLLWKF